MNDSLSIINYFEKALTWDIFLQGFFILNALIMGVALLFYISGSYHQKDQSFITFYSGKIVSSILQFYKIPEQMQVNDLMQKLTSITQFVAISTIFIMLSYTSGIITNHVSDAFMDQDNFTHLGLKKIWAPKDKIEGYRNTDKTIKLASFDKVFNFNNASVKDSSGNVIEPLSSDEKLQVYYEAKHEILASKEWKEYLGYSQNLVNLTQSFTFAAWLLIIFSCLALFYSVTTHEKFNYYLSRKFLLSIEFLWLASLSFIAVFNLFFPDIISVRGTKIILVLLTLLSIGGLFSETIKGNRVGTSILLLIISSYAYILAAIAWKNAEKETCAKTYGLLKYFNKEKGNKEMIKFEKILNNKKY